MTVLVKKLVLDVLKPHQPNALEFSNLIAAAGANYRVHLHVIEVDENTETVQIVIAGEAIDFKAVETSIKEAGGTVHSIDEVEVESENDAPVEPS